ncbi:hypothetical protein [Streptomyces sp. NPDC002324]
MSEFLNESDDQTEADDRLDQLLMSVDSELLTAINTAEDGNAPGRAPGNMYQRARSVPPRLVQQRKSLTERPGAEEESNGAVVVAVEALQEVMDALNDAGLGRDRKLAGLCEMTEVVQRALRTRTLTRSMADYYFDTAQDFTAALNTAGVLEGEEVKTLMNRLRDARRSVFYLFDHSDDYEGCYTPSRT